MWIKEIDENITDRNGVYDIGFIYQSGKIYLMDNHMAAAWCWLNELDIKKEYNFFHVDRHYDLLNNSSEKYLRSLSIEKPLNLQQFVDLEVEKTCEACNKQLFRFDNYIMNMIGLYPNMFKRLIFATHRDGSTPPDLEIEYYPEIQSLPIELAYQINEYDDRNWILNLDVDYFFTDKTSTSYMQFLDEEYIDAVCDQILLVYDKIDVITIAMSPYFCDGWKNAKRILERIAVKLNFDVELPDKYLY